MAEPRSSTTLPSTWLNQENLLALLIAAKEGKHTGKLALIRDTLNFTENHAAAALQALSKYKQTKPGSQIAQYAILFNDTFQKNKPNSNLARIDAAAKSALDAFLNLCDCGGIKAASTDEACPACLSTDSARRRADRDRGLQKGRDREHARALAPIDVT